MCLDIFFIKVVLFTLCVCGGGAAFCIFVKN